MGRTAARRLGPESGGRCLGTDTAIAGGRAAYRSRRRAGLALVVLVGRAGGLPNVPHGMAEHATPAGFLRVSGGVGLELVNVGVGNPKNVRLPHSARLKR